MVYGYWQGKRNRTVNDYFVAGNNLPWPVAMLSIVATETSVLTFISIPGLAYRDDWYFLQIASGYIIGRVLVTSILLPIYYRKGVLSIYQILASRYGSLIQKAASFLFLVTRVLADGVRFLAVGIIIQVITGWPLTLAIVIIGIVTVFYTVYGGFRAVAWVDGFQFILYIAGGIIAIAYIIGLLDRPVSEIASQLIESGKMQILHFDGSFIKNPNHFFAALCGGILLSFASHGVDYMMVQRVISTRNIQAAKKALIGSGIFVFIQFLVFLFAGSLIYIYYDGIAIETDREFPKFIAEILPIGIKGMLLAGILASAMSTLSSSINSLAASTTTDWFKNSKTLFEARFISAIWAVVLVVTAIFFNIGSEAVVIIGLQIASFTYGGLLGLFLLTKINLPLKSISLIIGLISSMLIVLVAKYMGVAWTWFIGLSVLTNIIVTIAVDRIISLIQRSDQKSD
ncbi:MAG: sodium:solute symporter [Candidatus Neomarinimicrobiota bacterium]